MKPIFKTFIIIAAIGMTLCTMHRFLRIFPAVREWTHCLLPAATIYDDAYFGLWFGLLMGVIILTIIIILKQGKEPAMPDKRFTIITYIATIIAFVVLALACGRTRFTGYSVPYLCVTNFEKSVLTITATTWLWLLTRQHGVGELSKPLRIAGIIGIVCLCIPLVRMLASAIYFFATGYLIYYDSWALASWTQITIPTFLFCWYSIELYMFSNET